MSRSVRVVVVLYVFTQALISLGNQVKAKNLPNIQLAYRHKLENLGLFCAVNIILRSVCEIYICLRKLKSQLGMHSSPFLIHIVLGVFETYDHESVHCSLCSFALSSDWTDQKCYKEKTII